MNKKSSLYKLFSGIYQRKDIDDLKSYINTTDGEDEFRELSRTFWDETRDMDEIPMASNQEARAFMKDHKLSGRRRFVFINSSIAAAILILLAIGYTSIMTETGADSGTGIRLVADQIRQPATGNEIEIVLEENKRIGLAGDTAKVKYKTGGQINVNDKDLVADHPKAGKKEVKYNQLIVPVGKRSTLELSDGTILWVNSGTNVVYPVEFDKNKREIFVNGEVYLDVYPNKDAPFFVRTNNLDIRVTGTEFNVTAYETDEMAAVVLVSGSVQVSTDKQQESVLTPGKRLTYAEGTGELNIQEVDVTGYISWKDGFYQSPGEKLGDILKRLSRYYGRTIEVSPEAAGLLCYGRLDLKDDLVQILNGLKQTAPITVNMRENQFIITLNKHAYE